MFCAQCGKQNNEGERFCRSCGKGFESSLSLPSSQNPVPTRRGESLPTTWVSKDPDELTGNGIGSVIMGDGFLMAAVFLSVTHSSISSLLWLLLLIPAFFFFGKGFADVLHAKQIRRRLKKDQMQSAAQAEELPPPRATVLDIIKDSRKLIAGPKNQITREL